MSHVFSTLHPKVILGVVAHADDLEFGVAGTVAKMISEGATGYYYILTNANKGSSDRSISSDQLRDLRRTEQRDACKILGVSEVFFGDYDDGTLQVSMDVKRDIARVIRKVKPEVVFTMDPTMIYDIDRGFINHPDHRAAGQATLDAVYPLARDHLSFPELLVEGLEPHKVETLLMTHFGEENFYIDISQHMETKLAALAAHTSQLPDKEATLLMVKRWATSMGSKVGAAYAEGFVRIDIKP